VLGIVNEPFDAGRVSKMVQSNNPGLVRLICSADHRW
jgi:hypothetical protein